MDGFGINNPREAEIVLLEGLISAKSFCVYPAIVYYPTLVVINDCKLVISNSHLPG